MERVEADEVVIEKEKQTKPEDNTLIVRSRDRKVRKKNPTVMNKDLLVASTETVLDPRVILQRICTKPEPKKYKRILSLEAYKQRQETVNRRNRESLQKIREQERAEVMGKEAEAVDLGVGVTEELSGNKESGFTKFVVEVAEAETMNFGKIDAGMTEPSEGTNRDVVETERSAGEEVVFEEILELTENVIDSSNSQLTVTPSGRLGCRWSLSPIEEIDDPRNAGERSTSVTRKDESLVFREVQSNARDNGLMMRTPSSISVGQPFRQTTGGVSIDSTWSPDVEALLLLQMIGGLMIQRKSAGVTSEMLNSFGQQHSGRGFLEEKIQVVAATLTELRLHGLAKTFLEEHCVNGKAAVRLLCSQEKRRSETGDRDAPMSWSAGISAAVLYTFDRLMRFQFKERKQKTIAAIMELLGGCGVTEGGITSIITVLEALRKMEWMFSVVFEGLM